MFEALKKAMGLKERKQLGWLFGLSRPGLSIGSDYRSMALSGYQANVYCMACVRAISMACGGIPWNAYRRKGDLMQEVIDHPLLDLLRRPNPWQGQSRFFENVVGFLMLSGDSYIYPNGPDRGPPRELYCLRPDRMQPIPGNNVRPVSAYRYTVGGVMQEIPAEKVLHLMLFNPLDDLKGMSPIQAAAYSIETGNEAKTWNLALLKNSGRPSGALVSEKDLTDAQFNRLKGELRDRYTGPVNAGRPVLLEGGLKWQEMSFSPADMAWLESQKLSAREISVAFGVPPELVGDSTNKTYSNYKEARKAFYQETVLPLMDWIRDELNNFLVPMFGDRDLFINYDRDSIDALQEDRNELWTRMNNASWLTINEKREACGYEAVEGGDVILVPATMIPTGAEPARDEGGGA